MREVLTFLLDLLAVGIVASLLLYLPLDKTGEFK